MIHINKQDDIAIVTLENGALNVLDTAFLKEILDCFKTLAEDDSKGVVITGAGRAFCAGVDLNDAFGADKDQLFGFMDVLSDCFESMFEFPKPLVAAINGHALAGGCIISSLCDYKVAAEGKAKIGITELAVGIPFPTVPQEIMRFILPQKSFQEVFYFAKGYSVADSHDLGLVDKIVPAEELMPAALKSLQRLISIPSQTFTKTKFQLRSPTIARYQSKAGRDYDIEMKEHWASDETKATVGRFLESLKK